MGQLFKNVASQKLRVFAFADAGHASLDAGEPVTGDAANITAQTAVDNAALGASNDVNPSEVDATNAPGYYEFDPTQAETNGDVVEWYPKSSTAGVQVVTVGGNVQTTQPQYFPDLGIESDGHAHADVKEIEGSDATDQIRDAIVDDATRIDASALNTAAGAIGSDGSGLTEAGGTGDHLSAVPDTTGTATLLSRLTATRAGYLDNLSAGAVATASALSTVASNVTTILGKWTGITSLAEWLGLLAGKQAGDATARTELRATGAGSGTFDETIDSLEAIRGTEPLGTAMRGTDGANTTTPPTAAAIADAVCDEALSGHTTAGTLAKALSDILADTDTTIPALIAALNDLSAADVNAEVDTAISDAGLATAAALATAQADLDTITGSDGVVLDTTQSNYAPAKAGDAMALTSAERNASADALLDRADAIETGTTPREAMRYMSAALVGESSSDGTVYKGVGVATVRITATMSGKNRNTVTLS